MLKVTLLGCGGSGGVPLIGGEEEGGNWGRCDLSEPKNRRTRTSALIEGIPGRRLLVDAGPDLRHQLLAARVARLEAVLFTHAHADHILGIDDLRQVNRVTGKELAAFGTRATLSRLDDRFDYAFIGPTPPFFFRPALAGTRVEYGQSVDVAGMSLRLFRQDHGVMDTLGFRVGGFAYSTDVVMLPEESLPALRGLDTWVVGCFQRAPHKVHANLEQVLEWVALLRPRRTVLTHMGIEMDYPALLRELPDGIEPGYDGMVLHVPD
jgi:phosphoribosyl 1,2-cyclic phosphate phosphodiesterase